jgi:DNA repair protein RecO (recombination protein O)
MKVRVQNQPAIILHQYPYSETSLILDVFTRQFGRVNLIAKGAKRPNSNLRAVLQLFQPLVISYSGAGDVKTLTSAEWVNGILPIASTYLISSFYMNELIRSVCAKDDPHEPIFNVYLTALLELSRLSQNNMLAAELVDTMDLHCILRKFEKALLEHLGFAMSISQDWLNTLHQDTLLNYQPNTGFNIKQDKDPSDWPIITQQSLQALLQNNYIVQPNMIKKLLGFMLAQHLKKRLHSKALLQDVQLMKV